VNAATGHALDDLFVGDVDLDHVVDRHAGSLHRFSLRNGAGEAVEQVAVLAVGFGQRAFTMPMMMSSETRPPASMIALAFMPSSVPALICARSMSPVEIWGYRIFP